MLEKLFLNILNYSFLLPLIFLIPLIKKIKVRSILWVLISYLLIFFFLNFFFSEIRNVLGKKIYYFIYTLFEYLTFTYLICHDIHNRKFRRVIVIFSCAFILFMFVFHLKAPVGRVDSIPVGIETIIILIYIFYFFYEHFKQVSNMYIYEEPPFWFVIGILVYLGSTFFLNILANTLNQEHIDKYYYLSYLGDIIKNVLFVVAIIQYARKPLDNKKQKNTNIPNLDLI